MDEIVNYFTEIFHLGNHYELPLAVVNAINSLDRAERGELKARLFNEAKRLGQGSEGLKAIRWLENAFEQIEKNSFRMHEVLFSPGQDIPENIAFLLSRAKKSIDLCVFTISDENLGHCLKVMHERGIKIRLITDNNKMRDAGSQVKDLARAGIQVKTDNSRYHMHNKFGIIDDRIVFTGSYNWTYTAKAFNQENMVITTNYTILHKFMDEFARLWEDMFWLRVKQQKDGRLKAMVNVEGQYQEVNTKTIDVSQTSQKKPSQKKFHNHYNPENIDNEAENQPHFKYKKDKKQKNKRRR